MGKLYKLRRAVRNDPLKWMHPFYGGARGAVFNERESWLGRGNAGWQPAGVFYDNPRSYKAFVRSALDEMKEEGLLIKI